MYLVACRALCFEYMYAHDDGIDESNTALFLGPQ